MLRQYPGYTITNCLHRVGVSAASEVTLTKDGDVLQERFNPYTGADMGEAHPRRSR